MQVDVAGAGDGAELQRVRALQAIPDGGSHQLIERHDMFLFNELKEIRKITSF